MCRKDERRARPSKSFEEYGLLQSRCDVILNYVFKSGALPQPCEAAGDVNCDGAVTASDIIYLVNHVFKSAAAPCDVCDLVPGMWACP